MIAFLCVLAANHSFGRFARGRAQIAFCWFDVVSSPMFLKYWNDNKDVLFSTPTDNYLALRFVLAVPKFTCLQLGIAHGGLAITPDCLWCEVCIRESAPTHGAGTALSMCVACSAAASSRFASDVCMADALEGSDLWVMLCFPNALVLSMRSDHDWSMLFVCAVWNAVRSYQIWGFFL